ncbi:MAG: tRNA (adenosine(37)-N6)-threonylcarbamoyltransferase complex transferase subunit TsaD [Candidatus Dadabacteria bacterium]|nr:MAG: tRNA (adenosine(37)-N6)-threonylcarbamoyltransferase complex transferase subunit TsaD [Candidatus Dadabacteria bacterium]
MLVMGIETSCDETALAVLEFEDRTKFKIISEVLSSQAELHSKYGGVVPELASREHLRNLPILAHEVLNESSLALDDIDLIGVTTSPGLLGCLLMGLGFVKGLSLASNTPFIAVNHIEAHLLSIFLSKSDLQFPFLGVVVSGGHSEIYLVKGFSQYTLISKTLDDAAGEAFDKCAALLDLPYPGGPSLAKLAETSAKKDRFIKALPKIMKNSINFSFAGFKTAVSLLIKKEKEKNNGTIPDNIKADLAWAIQEAIVESIIFKIKQALEICPVKAVVITGGVACNERLREKAKKLSISSYFPLKKHCSDNGAMIAFAGYQNYLLKGASSLKETAISQNNLSADCLKT